MSTNIVTDAYRFYSRTLHYYLWLRLLALGVQAATLGALHLVWRPILHPAAAFAAVAGLGAITLWCFHCLRDGWEVTVRDFMAQLLIDVAALALLLYFTGGATNPFAPLFLLPVVVAAATLTAPYVWLIALVAVACYTSLMFFHAPLHAHGDAGADFRLHVWGMWIGFLIAAGLVAFFVSRIGAALRDHDRALARAREEALRNEQVLALGTLAASTAHALGTPLSTIAVLAKDLEDACTNDPALVRDLKLLRAQIDRCKQILARMALDAGQLQAGAGLRMTVDQYLREVIGEWRGSRPHSSIDAHCAGPSPAPQIVADRTLTLAIINVLDNAAETSGDAVLIQARWDERELRIAVRDRGPGIAPQLARRLGQPFVTTKPAGSGLGLGLFLARTTLDRLGGSLRFSTAEDGGNLAEITLPLGPLLVGGAPC